MPSFFEKYKACHAFVQSIDDLPPTYEISGLANTNPMPDPDFYNDTILQQKFDAYDNARNNVIDKCGFDPAKKFR
jgi:hypothetical protein